MPIHAKRYRYIDYFKAISIVLVILGHINYANSSIVAWIYSFHMPAFFFASGLVLKDNVKNGLSERSSCVFTIWKKFEGIIIPYFIWALFYAELSISNILKILYGSQKMLSSSGTLTSLWFLTALFLAIVYFELAKLLFRKNFKLPVKCCLLVITSFVAALLPSLDCGYPWNLDVSFSAFGFLLLGNILSPVLTTLHDKLDGLSRSRSIPICIGTAILSFFGLMLYRINLQADGGAVIMAKGIYGKYYLFLITAMLGGLFLLSISFLFDLIIPKMDRDILSFIGQNTFCIFVVHKPLISVLFAKLFSVLSLPASLELIISCIGVLTISCILSLFINHYLPFLAGKSPSKQ